MISKNPAAGDTDRFRKFIASIGTSRVRYMDIVNNLVDAVEKGSLLPGDKLPPQRSLAHKLNVAVGTVTRAYAEVERRGIVMAEVGRGTFVAGMAVPYPLATDRRGQELMDFSHNRLPIDGYVGEFCKTLGYIAKRPNVAAMLDYPPNTSDMRFRAIGANWIGQIGLSASPDRVVVCNGVQHGLSVILGALSNPGDLVLCEALNFPGIRLLERTYHLRLQGVQIDEHGILPDALESACKRDKAKFLFCQPTVHNPTAAVMPVERRKTIAEIVERYGLMLIEDDIYAFLPSKPTPPISVLIPDRSFYLTGTSKTIGTGIRVGYIVAPLDAVHQLTATVHATTWIPAPFMVEVASTWLTDGTANRIMENHRAAAKQRQEIVRQVLGEFEYQSHESAFHIWLSLPKPWRQEEFVTECLNRSVAVNSSENFVVGQAPTPQAVRICLGGFRSTNGLERGLEIIREVLLHGHRHRTFMV
jgi:DNA-binding transcriptional MocR family regulator